MEGTRTTIYGMEACESENRGVMYVCGVTLALLAMRRTYWTIDIA